MKRLSPFWTGVVAGLALFAGCGSEGGGVGGNVRTGGGGGNGSSFIGPDGCSDLFGQDVLRDYSFEIADDQWALLSADFENIQAVLAGTPPESYRPIVFRHGSETVADAAVRLKGQSSWVDTVNFDANPKMQFVVAFDQTDPNGSFHGVHKLVFDMPRADWTFLNGRAAYSWFREIGIMAPCASSGTLTINGTFYGVYVTEESKGPRLIKQFFPTNPDGDLLKGGIEPDGETMPNLAREMQFWMARDMASLAQIVDVPNSLLAWAAEAVLNDSDGYYGGSHNYYIYDQGSPGYVFVPTDEDSTIEWLTLFDGRVGVQQHPIYWWAGRSLPQPPGQHYLVVMNDQAARAQYVNAVATQLAKWDGAKIAAWFDAWSKQIANAVGRDTHKWATVDGFHMAIGAAKDAAVQRPQFLSRFLDCERGMPADDKDGDGVAWCNDCADDNAAARPGAPEICNNNFDDNCDGVVDENCPGEQPGYPGQPAPNGGAAAM